MKKISKCFLWIFLISAPITFMQNLHADQQNSDQITSFQSHSDVRSCNINNDFMTNLSNYWQSPLWIDKVVGFSMQASLMLGIGLFFIWLKQGSTDLVGNQAVKIYYPGDITTKFDDVAGLAGAKADMQDVISYLKNPDMYKKIGARVPKGILMNGGPGNGKTLLAKAVAGMVNCPFITAPGSSFVQMYAGLGAARVRDLFKIAQELAAEFGGCIIFIDEIDALAKSRSSLSGSGIDRDHDQTVAQLLECMDGLSGSDYPIIVIGATNRAELLDSAVVRPGRFDRKVEITKPVINDRIALITVALTKIKHVTDLNIESIARLTGGFSGAELINLINDAAILAVSEGRTVIESADIALAFDHLTLGRQIEGMERSKEQSWTTAIHEAGHAIGWIFGKNTKYVVHKASIVPRSRTLGVVWAIPVVEFYNSTATEMKSKIVMALCGRTAELEFGMDLSDGATSDLAKANNLAYDMVIRYGMVPELYNTYYNKENPLATNVINKEVKKIIDECTAMAKYLITTHKQDIEKIAKLLMEKGTVLGDEIYTLLGLQIPQGAQFNLA